MIFKDCQEGKFQVLKDFFEKARPSKSICNQTQINQRKGLL